MSRDLVIRAPASPEGQPRWVLVQDGRRKRSGDGLPPATDAAYDRLFMVLPGSDVFLSRVKLPARSEKEARQAAPFLIEDELATPLEDTATFVGRADPEGHRLVYAVQRPLAEAWQTIAAKVEAKVRYFLPEGLAVADFAEDAVLFGDDGDLLVCRPRADRPVMRIEADLLAETLPVALQAAKPETLAVSENIDWTEIVGVPLPQPRRFAPFDLAVKISSLPEEFLSGLPSMSRAERSEGQWLVWLTPFRRAGMILMATLLAGATLLGAEGLYYQAQRAAIDDAGTDLFAETFPDMRAVNPEFQLRQQIDALSGVGGSDFLALATAVAELTGEVDGVRVDTLRYDRTLNVLNVSATYSDFSDFEQLNAASQALGVVLEDGGVRQNGGTLNGDFAVRLR